MDTHATPPVVVCRGLTKTYGTGDTAAKALRGADLDVRPGELLMLVGPSGCGKTTLISIIAGILNQDQGDCSLFGQDIASLSPRQRVRFRGRHVGFVFQAFNLVPCLSVLHNVAVPLLINGVKLDTALRQARICLTSVGLGDRAGSAPTELSGGQQQRVAIARALVHNPGLVVCDEPTSALDHTTGARIMDMLKLLALRDNRALVIVTHDPRIFPYADRIAHMDDGIILETRSQTAQEPPACA